MIAFPEQLGRIRRLSVSILCNMIKAKEELFNQNDLLDPKVQSSTAFICPTP